MDGNLIPQQPTAAVAPAMSDEDSADAIVENIVEELICAVCGCIFVDPRMLACQHCFCLRCLFSQATHDRGAHLQLRCAFRCPQTTTTPGDIRTLPKNPIITSMAALLRKRRARILKAKHEALMADAEASRSAQGGPAADGRTQTREDEYLDCEWCSMSTVSCELCPYCQSRVCSECRGVFGDHQFLCLAQHEKGGRRVGRELVDAVAGNGAGNGDGEDDGDEEAAQYPFLLSPDDAVVLLVKRIAELVQGSGNTKTSEESQEGSDEEAVQDAEGVTDANVNLVMKDVHICSSVMRVRVACPLWSVECSQNATGFSSTIKVLPPLTIGPLEVQPTDVHWGRSDLGAEVLLFLGNMVSIARRVIDAVNETSVEMAQLLEELSSYARQDLIARNRGLHLYVGRSASVAKMQIQVARNCVLALLYRARMIEGLMGDMVVNRYSQLFSQCPISERHNTHNRCISFLKSEVLLSERLDETMHRLDTVCFGAELVITQILSRLRSMSAETSSSTSPLVRPGSPLSAKRTQTKQRSSREYVPRSHGSRNGSVGRSPVATFSHTAAGGEAGKPAVGTDPIFEPYADFTFLGQFEERLEKTRAGTSRLLATLEDFLKIRHWVWTYTNTTVRSCGLSETDRNEIILGEETIQRETDQFFSALWQYSKLLHALETYVVDCERQKMPWPAEVIAKMLLSPLETDDSVTDTPVNRSQSMTTMLDSMNSTSQVTATDPAEITCFNIKFTIGGVREGLSNLRGLRAYLLMAESMDIGMPLRGFATQSELLNMMKGLINAAQKHHIAIVQAMKTVEEAYVTIVEGDLRRIGAQPVPLASPSATEAEAVTTLHYLISRSDEEVAEHYQSGACAEMAPPQDDKQAQTLFLDVYRRSAGISVCCSFGEALIDASHGITFNSLTTSQAQSPLTDPPPANGAAADRVQPPPVTHARGPTAGTTSNSAPTSTPIRSRSLFPRAVSPRSGWAEGANADGEANPIGDGTFLLPASEAYTAAEHVFGRSRSTSNNNAGRRCSDSSDASSHRSPSGNSSAVVDMVAPGENTSDWCTTTAESSQSNRLGGGRAAAGGGTDGPGGAGHSVQSAREVARLRLGVEGSTQEFLFAADDDVDNVLQATARPTREDSQGCERAAGLFTKHFRIPCDQAVPLTTETLALPFYAGSYRYKDGASHLFLVDAQNGNVWLEAPESSVAKVESYSLLSSVSRTHLFFFFLANVAVKYFFQTDMTIVFSS